MAFPLFDKILTPTVTFTPDSAAYSANDVIGDHTNGTTAAMSFDISGTSSGAGIVNSLIVADSEGIGAAGAIWLFTQDLATPIVDNAAFAVVFADWANLITVLTLPAYVSYSSTKVAVLTDINDLFRVTKNTIFGYFVPSGAPDWGTTKSVTVKLGILTQ